MTTIDILTEVLAHLPEDRLCEILDFAQFVQMRVEQEQWQRFGREQLSRAYGPEEPEYTEADLKSEKNP